MNILIIYPFLLHKQINHGSGIRILRLIHELNARGHYLYVLSLAETDPQPYNEDIQPIQEMCRDLCIIQRPRLNPALKAYRFLLPGVPPHPRNIVHPKAEAYVREMTASGIIDLVYLVFTATGEYIKSVDRSKCSVILDADNLETRHYSLQLEIEKSIPQRMHSFITLQRMKRYEGNLFQTVDQIISITSDEKEFIRKINPQARVSVIPAMVDTSEVSPTYDSREEDALLFVGSFTYYPNVEAITWFCQEVMPLVIQKIPTAHLYIIGYKARTKVSHLANSTVQIVDYVEDLQPWLAKTSIFVSPVRSGGGARMKNLDALTAGLPLVTTSLGAEGLAELPGKAYLVADDANNFAKTLINLLLNPSLRKKIGQSGRLLVERAHDVQVVGMKLEQLLLLVKKDFDNFNRAKNNIE